ncbi:MAG: T9SS type A sorting domain-containing protein [Deltaproteobacteria bacterium]
MKNYLQKSKLATFLKLFAIGLSLVFVTDLSAQCNTKISDPDKDKKDYVCAKSTTTYQAVRTGLSLGSTISWTLSGGGTIIATSGLTSGTTATVTVRWDSLPGAGPFCLTMTETNTTCTGSDKLYVYIERQNLVMACNDLVLIALDNFCRDTVSADEILEAPLYPNDSYTVTLFSTNGQPRVAPIATMQDLGDTLMVLVKHTCSGLACMSNVAFQDKLATMLSCRADTIKIKCNESTEPENTNVGFPLIAGSTWTKLDEGIYRATIPGDCGGTFRLVFTDKVQTKACGNLYQYVIQRTWTAIDNSGNSWSCTETIATKWGDFDTMKMPCNWDGLNGRKYFQCYDPHPNPSVSYYWPYRDSIPPPEITGYPEYITCSNIQFLYEDVVIPVCGYTRKVLRQWIILDWCTGRTKTCDQVLSFVDDNPPIFYVAKDTLKFTSDPKYCYGTVCLPPPTVAFECSNWTYEVVGYHFKGDGNCDPELSRDDFLYKNLSGTYCIDKVPVDTPVCVIYKVTDECGKYAYGNVLVIVQDKIPPTAACEAHTVVTLGDGAKFYASSLDDKSWDNCGIKKLEIKRTTNRCNDNNDLYFRDYVNLCCADVGKDVMVILRATDLSGNINECMGTVKVVDLEKPVLTSCPKDFTVNCDQNYSDIFTGGKPTATDNCDNLTITKQDVPFLNECGIGYVTRTWTIKDGSGNETVQKCIQKITVVDGKPLVYADIKWPKDLTLTGCYPGVNIDEAVTGLPEILNPACKKLGISHSDVVVQGPQGSPNCVQILRKFKIGDWCRPQMPFIEHTQIISVLDGGAPTFTYCPSDTTVLTGDACSANVTVSALATDDCTKPNDLKYTYKVDKGNNGSFELNGTGRVVSTTFERGLNKIVFTVTDGCGNSATCTRIVRVKDSKPPTPVCIHKLTTSLGNMGMVTLKARTFNRASTDNCTPSNLGECGCGTMLRFSFSPNNVNDTLRTFNCDSLDNGVGQIFTLNVWVWDLDDNKDWCIVQLNVIDSKNVCPDIPSPIISVRGKINDELGNGMNEFTIKGKGILFDDLKTTVTDEAGNYDLDKLGAYNKYEIAPDKNDNPMDGLTTLDLVLIQKHILGIKRFDNPFKYIAADANNSNSITAADLLELRKLILGIDNQLKTNESWKFLRSDTKFEDPNYPWEYEIKYITDSLYFGVDSLDFIAVKIGDLNRSATVYNPAAGLNFRNTPVKSFVTNNTVFANNELVPVAIKLDDSETVTGFQYTLEFDPSVLKFAGIEDKRISMGSSNYNVLKADEGIITFSWNEGKGIKVNPDDVLFSIVFKTLQGGELKEVINITSGITKAEIYDEDMNLSNLKLRFEGDDNELMEVKQNIPNPFSQTTELSFYLPQDDDVSIRVFNTTGKTYINTQGHYSKGQNTITISKTDLDDSGIYFYEIKNRNSTVLKKMVLIK